MRAARFRELALILLAVVVGGVGLLAVAGAKTGTLTYDAWPGVAAVGGGMLALHLLVRWRLPLADPYLLPIVSVLVSVGLVTLYRVSPELAKDQAIWVGVGAAVFAAVILVMPNHHMLERYRYIIGTVGVLLLVVTAIFGTRISGAKLWIEIGGGQTIQLGEVSKVLIVIFLAGYLRERREVLAVPTERHLGLNLPAARHFGPMFVVLGAALALVGLLNDFGTALLFFGVFLAMLYLASGRATYVLVGAGLFAVGAAAVWAAVPRIQDRVDTWLQPFSDAQNTGYQMVQSLYALADGGLVGPGFGRGFLVKDDGSPVIPALQTDFIFSGVAAELGFIGAVAVICVFLLFAARGLAIAARANDGFSKLLAAGLTTVLALQTIVILGGITRLVPLTGVTLPFMSYGGSSVVTNFALVAILLVVSHRSRAPWRERPPRLAPAEDGS